MYESNDTESRVQLHKSVIQTIADMSEGNPGALTALFEVIKEGDVIDPDNAFGGFSVVLTLDTLRIYGSDIWVIFNDVCDRSPVRMIALARSVQLGFCSHSEFKSFVQAGYGVDKNRIDELVAAVRERLPAFRQTDE